MNRSWKTFLSVFCILLFLSGCHVSGSTLEETLPPETLPAGWHTEDGKTCYILPGGTPATGWLEVDGSHYYFRAGGEPVTGWLELDGQLYYLSEDGSAVSGLQTLDGVTYIFNDRGALAAGWTQVGDTRYCADSSGHPLSGWLEDATGLYYLDENGTPVTGWLEEDGWRYYLTEDGSAARGEYSIQGQTHFFTSLGREILLVNPWHSLPEDHTVELTDIGNGHRISVDALEDLEAMLADCKAAGLKPVIRSSYRTQEQQEYLYARRIRRFEDQGYSHEEAVEAAGTIVAIPGTSEHQLGLALDIVDQKNQNLDESQAETATQQWLMENSWRYGWILRYPNEKSEITGIIYEPWHYRYVGRELAEELHTLDLCLEEYLQMLTT